MLTLIVAVVLFSVWLDLTFMCWQWTRKNKARMAERRGSQS